MFPLPSRAFPGGDNEYNRLVDEELDSIENALDTICDDVDNLDYNIAVLIIIRKNNEQSGVLSINMGSKGAYVINKQSPNKQIWWASPIRYN